MLFFLSLCSFGRQWTTGINIDIIILLLYDNSVINLDYYQTFTICHEFTDFSSKGCTCNSFKGHCEYYMLIHNVFYHQTSCPLFILFSKLHKIEIDFEISTSKHISITKSGVVEDWFKELEQWTITYFDCF